MSFWSIEKSGLGPLRLDQTIYRQCSLLGSRFVKVISLDGHCWALIYLCSAFMISSSSIQRYTNISLFFMKKRT